MIDNGNRVLPNQLFLRNFRPEVARAWTHVTMRQLEPRASERVGELIRISQEAPRDLLVLRVEAQREVRRQHRRHELLRLIERVRNRRAGSLGNPLMCAGRALAQLPLVAEQILEEVVAPLRRRRGPGHFESAGDRIGAVAGAELVVPTEALHVEVASFWLDAGPTG